MSSSQSYTLPATDPRFSSQSASNTWQPPTAGTTTTSQLAQGPVINYVCGECNNPVPLSAADAVRCKDCGHRVLYKERTKRMVQFEAR